MEEFGVIMKSPILRMSHFLKRRLPVMLLLSTFLRQSLLVFMAPVPGQQQQENVNFDYTQNVSNRTSTLSSSVDCLAQVPNNHPNGTTLEYRLSMSFGDGLFVLGFVGVLIVLKSLLTKITILENQPDDSNYILSMDEPLPAYRITLQRRMNGSYNNPTITPPHSSCLEETLSMSLIRSPISYTGNQCGTLSSHDRRCSYYGAQCLFSSPEASTKCLV